MWQIEVMWRATPWAPYWLAVTLAVAIVAARPLARRGRTSVVGAGLWVALMGVLVTLTMTPGLLPLGHHQCGLIAGWPSWGELFSLHERALNVWMYVPAAFLAVLPRQRRTWVTALAATAALPVVAELAQWAFPVLGRQCQLSDVTENLTGVAIGAATGLAVHLLVWLADTGRTAREVSADDVRGPLGDARTGGQVERW